MVTTAFAESMASVREAVALHLANATAVYQGGEPFGIRLFNGEERFLGEIDAPKCTASFDIANTPGLHEGDERLQIDGAFYRISSAVRPDPSGWVKVSLDPVGGW